MSDLYSYTKDEITKFWNKHIVEVIKIYYAADDIGSFMGIYDDLTGVDAIISINVSPSMENKPSSKNIQEVLTKKSKEIYRSETKRAEKEYSNTFFLSKLFNDAEKIDSPDKIYKKLESKVTYEENMDAIKLDHQIIALGTPCYFVNLRGRKWDVYKKQISDIHYFWEDNSAEYFFEGEDVRGVDGKVLSKLKKEKCHIEVEDNIYIFFNENEAISFYNKEIDLFNDNNKKINSKI